MELNIPLPLKRKNTRLVSEFSNKFSEGISKYILMLMQDETRKNNIITCRNMNYWIEDMRDEFDKKILPLYKYKEDEQVWEKYIEKEYLINLNNIIGDVCQRTPIPYIKAVRDIRKEIEAYCYERDEVLEELEKYTLTKKEKCDFYNKWMNQKKALFRKKPAWHIYASNPRYKSAFKISCNCDTETMFQNKLNCQNEYRKRSKKIRKFKKIKSKTSLQQTSQKGSDNEEENENEDEEDQENEEDEEVEENEKKSSPYGKEKTKDEEGTPIKNDEQVTNPTYHEPKKQKTTKAIERSFDSHNPRNKIIPVSTSSSTTTTISPTLSTIPKTSSPVTATITSTITTTTPSLYTPITSTTLAQDISSSINPPKRTTVLPRISHNTDTISDNTISTKNMNALNNEDEIKYRRFPENIHKGDKILIEKIHNEDTKTSDAYKKILPGKSGQAGPPGIYQKRQHTLKGKSGQSINIGIWGQAGHPNEKRSNTKENKHRTIIQKDRFQREIHDNPNIKDRYSSINNYILKPTKTFHQNYESEHHDKSSSGPILHNEKPTNYTKPERSSVKELIRYNDTYTSNHSESKSTKYRKYPQHLASTKFNTTVHDINQNEIQENVLEKFNLNQKISPHNPIYYLGNILDIIEQFLITLYSNKEKTNELRENSNPQINKLESAKQNKSTSATDSTPTHIPIVKRDVTPAPKNDPREIKEQFMKPQTYNMENDSAKDQTPKIYLPGEYPHEVPIALPTDPKERSKFIIPEQIKPIKTYPPIIGHNKSKTTPPNINLPPSVLKKYPHIAERYKGYYEYTQNEGWGNGYVDVLHRQNFDSIDPPPTYETYPYDIENVITGNNMNKNFSFPNKSNEYNFRDYNIPKHINLHVKPDDSANNIAKVINIYDYLSNNSKTYKTKHIDLHITKNENYQNGYRPKKIDIPFSKNIKPPPLYRNTDKINGKKEFIITTKTPSDYTNEEITTHPTDISIIIPDDSKSKKEDTLHGNVKYPFPENIDNSNNNFDFTITKNPSLNYNNMDITTNSKEISNNIHDDLINPPENDTLNHSIQMIDIPSENVKNSFFDSFHNFYKNYKKTKNKKPLLNYANSENISERTKIPYSIPLEVNNGINHPEQESNLHIVEEKPVCYKDENYIETKECTIEEALKQNYPVYAYHPDLFQENIGKKYIPEELSSQTPSLHNIYTTSTIENINNENEKENITIYLRNNNSEINPPYYNISTNKDSFIQNKEINGSYEQKEYIKTPNQPKMNLQKEEPQISQHNMVTSESKLTTNFNSPQSSKFIYQMLGVGQTYNQNDASLNSSNASSHDVKLERTTSYPQTSHSLSMNSETHNGQIHELATSDALQNIRTDTIGTLSYTSPSTSSTSENSVNTFTSLSSFHHNAQSYLGTKDYLPQILSSHEQSGMVKNEKQSPQITIKGSNGSIAHSLQRNNGYKGSNILNIVIQIATLFVGGFMIMAVFHKRNIFIFGAKKKKKKKKPLSCLDETTYVPVSEEIYSEPISYELLENNEDLEENNYDENNMDYIYPEEELIPSNTGEIIRENQYTQEEDNIIKYEEKHSTLIEQKKTKWKSLIETHLKILEEYKMEEWDIHKGDFLEICLQEFNNIQDFQVEKKELENETNKHILYNDDDIERQNFLWNIYIENNRYISDQWKNKKWFQNIKTELQNEMHNFIKQQQQNINITKMSIINPLMERQKGIWREWIKKQNYIIYNYINEEWFKQVLKLYKQHYNVSKDNLKNNKIYIIRILTGIFMIVLEEYMKEECTIAKKAFLDRGLEKMNKRDNSDINAYITDIINSTKKNIYISNKEENNIKYKKEKWYLEMKEDWIRNEYKYLSSIKNQNILENDLILRENKSLIDIQKDISRRHWDDLQIKWIDEDNENDWLKIAETKFVDKKKGNYKKPKDKKKNIQPKKEKETYHNKLEKQTYVEESFNNMDDVKLHKMKTVIEIHMELLDESQREDWELNRKQFLEICIEEFSNKLETEKKNIIKSNELQLNIDNEKIINHMIEKQNMFIQKIMQRNKFLLERWKRKEWFHKLKENWKIQEKNNSITQIQGNNMENSKTERKNIMLEKQKIIWKKWVAKNVMHIEESNNESLLQDFITNNENIYFQDKKNLNNIKNQNNNIYENSLKKYTEKKLLTVIWIDIHMMVLDELKKEEIQESKIILLDKLIDGLKNKNDTKTNQPIIHIIKEKKENILQHKRNNVNIYQRVNENIDFKWINEEYKNCNILQEKIDIYDMTVKNPILDIQTNILLKNWENMQIKWIDDNNENDWLKIST
ncbi:surface-associated interspersed protein 13.1, putative [Plasmodium reichenowi]|uniref:Surface-associated interspersed protein 13.1, putative n=1 Tax=Plasmodium reichenowi TaxID=5854 RepID=A0A2P9DKV3_PLARE|nr:surface-associated interspersed protein 13.1, putative [Plasmodium reichenowi]